jgi:aspartyl-tRNA(Asn)/glutamyl-tRNA(Gln) amidotransferase subunit C
MSQLGKDEVEELALLARLKLDADEIERLAGELSAILGYVEQLQEVDTTGVEPMTHAVPLDCPVRPDVVAPSFSVDEALADAPEREDDSFAVPRILPVES